MAKKKPEKRKLIDWDSVEPLYRAGQMSLYEICRQYEADHVSSQVWKPTVTHTGIRKKAKEKGWSKKLAKRVSERVQEKLVSGFVSAGNQTDDEIIEKATEEPVKIAKGQRYRTQKTLEFQDELFQELKDQFRAEKKAAKNGKPADVISKVKAFKELVITVKSLQDQQAEQYKLNDAGGEGDSAVINVTVDNYGD